MPVSTRRRRCFSFCEPSGGNAFFGSRVPSVGWMQRGQVQRYEGGRMEALDRRDSFGTKVGAGELVAFSLLPGIPKRENA